MTVRKGYDVVVVGGGTAGAIAGIAAARSGARTLLVEQYGSLGGVLTLGMSLKGVNDGEGRKALGGVGEELIERARRMNGATEVTYHPRHGSIMGQDPEAMKLNLIEMVKESGLELLLHSFLVDAEVKGRAIRSIRLANKAGLEIVTARCFVDCTGDGDLCRKSRRQLHLRPREGRAGPAGLRDLSGRRRRARQDLGISGEASRGLRDPRRLHGKRVQRCLEAAFRLVEDHCDDFRCEARQG